VNAKEKISLIAKILLVILLVPIGVTSLAKSTTGNIIENVWVGSQFTSTTAPVRFDNCGYTYTDALTELGYPTIHPNTTLNKHSDILYNYARVFRFKKDCSLGGGTYSSQPPAASGDSPETVDGNIQYINQWWPVDLKNVWDMEFQQFGNYDVNRNKIFDISYALSFYNLQERLNTIPEYEKRIYQNDFEDAQETLLHYTDESDTVTNVLYYANEAYSNAKKIKDSHPISGLTLTVDENEVGSDYKDGYFIVGPFEISDHAYAANLFIDDYSGADITGDYKQTIVGLTSTKITIKHANGITNSYATSSNSLAPNYFYICYDDEGGGTATNTGYCENYENISVPVQYTSNKVPYPNQKFYVKIDESLVSDGSYLTNITLTARDTISDGNGQYFTATNNVVQWTKQTQMQCSGSKCNVCNDVFLCYSNTNDHNDEHDCSEYNCRENGKIKKINLPGDFLYKTVAVAENANAENFISDEPIPTAPNFTNELYRKRWAMAVVNTSEIFKDMYNHIKKGYSGEEWKLPDVSKLIKSNGKYNLNNDEIKELKQTLAKPIYCNANGCNCKAFIFLGNAEGESNIKHGTDNQYMLDVYIGEDFTYDNGTGFIKRRNKSDGNFADQTAMGKSTETWYIDNEKINKNEISNHYHEPGCYRFSKPSETNYETTIICGAALYSDIHQYTGKYWDYNSAPISHKHTLACWKEYKGVKKHTHTYTYSYTQTKNEWYAAQPLLVVENCSTKVLKKELSLDLDIKLTSGVSVYKWIDKVGTKEENSWKYKSGSDLEMVFENKVGKASDCDYGETPIQGTTKWGNITRYGYEEVYKSLPGYPGGMKVNNGAERIQTEDWKKQYPAVIEAGDIVTYKIKIKNEKNEKVYITLEDYLPKNMKNTGSEGYVYIKRESVLKEDSTLSANIDGNPSLSEDKILTTQNFYGAKKHSDGKYYLSMEANQEIVYSIKIHEIDSAENSYDLSNPVSNRVKVTGVYTADDKRNQIANLGERTESSDYYVCKQYNVSVNMALTDVWRADESGSIKDSGQYVYDEDTYSCWDSNRLNKEFSDSDKEKNPIYVENGDIVTYQMKLKNNANNTAPYYSPKKVRVSLKFIKPTPTATFYKASISNDLTVTYKEDTQMFDYIPIANGEEIEIWISFRMNGSNNVTYDYNTLRTATVNIENVKNTNGKITTPIDGLAYCDKEGYCSSCRNLARAEYECVIPYCKKVNQMTDIVDGKILNGGQIVNNINKSQATSSDYFRVKEYNIVVDKYIKEVSHTESRGGTSTTYSGTGRKIDISDPKTELKDDGTVTFTNKGGTGSHSDEVYVEYGDKVTYEILIYNTTDDNNYEVGRKGAPYKSPQWISVDLTDELPKKYSDLQVNNYPMTVDSDGKLHLNNLKMAANGIYSVTVSLVVEEVEKEKIETNTATISNWRNINDFAVINNGNRNSASDKYKLNDYSATLNEYVYSYDASMEEYNISNGFTSGNSGKFVNGTEANNSYSNEKPLDVEKYEKVVFATRVTNTVTGNEEESASGTYKKYNTRVRPTEVVRYVDYGLRNNSNYNVTWYKADGTVKQDITINVKTVTSDDSANKRTKIVHTIMDDNIILSPGEYIVYYLGFDVTESNLTLRNLRSYSQITTLTNVNKNSGNERIVTQQNAPVNTADQDYVRLKDAIIAGKVWLDTDKDGYDNNGETGKKDITVKLYRADQTNPVKEVKTDENGYYSFGRQWKAKTKNGNQNYTSSEYIDYYVEFEYDGVAYKATDVYGGDTDGQADGMHNLKNGGQETGEKWRQGYAGLPGTTSGDEKYLTDSNAYEFDNKRNDINREYQTIGYNYAYTGSVEDIATSNALEYDKDGHISTFIEDNTHIMKARSFIKQDFNMEGNGVQENLENTNTLFLQNYNGYHNEYPETEYLKFINLGLVRREEVDISLTADVHSVKTTINGEEMIYDFYNNKVDSTADDYSSKDDAYKLKEAYELDLYETDYNYKHDTYYDKENVVKDYKGEESELTTEITYRVKLDNKKIDDDIPVEVAFNEIAIYFDENFISKQDIEAFKEAQENVKNKNDETGLLENSSIKAIKVYYDTEEKLDAQRDVVDISSEISFESKYSSNQLSNTNKSELLEKGYNVLNITSKGQNNPLDNWYLKEGESRYLEIKLVVDKDTARNLKIEDSKDGNMGLEMIAEVNAYTTKFGYDYKHKVFAEKYAGLIDVDSNPGSVVKIDGIEDYDNYEDDTYKTGIKLDLLDDTRTVTGFVWDDAKSSKAGTQTTGIQYLGNGEYNVADSSLANTNPNIEHKNDKPISDVKVSLVEIIHYQDENGKTRYYEYPAKDKDGNLIETKTDANGKYTLKDFIPGYYKVRFDYGVDDAYESNVIYNGQDYKSTTYFNENYYSGDYETDNIGAVGNFEYFDDVKTSLNKQNKSDAQDDEIRRLNVNSYSETMTAVQSKVFAEANSYRNALMKNTHMYADSTIFYAKPEEKKSREIRIDATQENFNTNRLWNIKNLDFGLEYRAESSIELDKNIETLELITSDNKTLVKLYFKEENGAKVIDENKSIGYKNVQYMPNDGKKEQGFVYLNMDADILVGCTVKVEYSMDATNSSEVDRINKNLDDIRYEKGAVDKGYRQKVYIGDNYSANGTAAQLLSNEYYEGYNFNTTTGEETFKYLKKLKKSYNSDGNSTINGTVIEGKEYYGKYLGQTYYTGNVGTKDIVAKLKIDHILDYIDNDFSFSSLENSTENRMWQTTTSQELQDGKLLDFEKVNKETYEDEEGREMYNLIDKYGVRYDTENRSNLVLSVNDNKKGNYSDERTANGNASLSRFLNTNKYETDSKKSTGRITAIATKVLSAEDISAGRGLSYENIAEIVQYTTLTGRRTKLPDTENGSGGVIGNANVSFWNGYDVCEDDTGASEVITISPPTGLAK